MMEKIARKATRRRACDAFDGQNRDDVRVAAAADALKRAHAITIGLHTEQ